MCVDFRESMRQLDIEQGGIFPAAKRTIASGTSYLIVSFGGIGGDALDVIKNKLERYVDKDEQEKYVRLLAIDTERYAKTTIRRVQDGTGAVREVQVDRFTDREFFWPDNVPARNAVQLYDRDPALQQWMNPRLPYAIEADPTLLDGHGAAGNRQLGRALLYPTDTVRRLNEKIRALVRDITNGNHNNLKVIIVSGISGGTGSGIVVDASYLIRDFITPLAGAVGSRTEYLGFLLLPPTGKSNDNGDIRRGNRNGIAALKEIDHFMTIAYRGEKYSAALGGRLIESNKNIFDTCYLIDGVHTGYAVGNPREKANEVVSDCILDMLTSQVGGGPAGNTTASVDSFMSDASGAAKNMLMTTPEQRAPRNANYVYCAIGHGKVLIPLELMKAYVAKTVFDKIYASFVRCVKVDEDGAKNFVEGVKVRPFNPNIQQRAIREKVDELFADPKYGPFYTVNLLNEAAEYARQRAYILSARPIRLPWNRERMEQYEFISKYTHWLNKETFRIYTTVLEEMQRYLAEQHDILCDSRKLEAYGGSTNTFTPIDFGGTDTKAQAVRKYLDGLVSYKRVSEIANALLREMADHRKEWTELETRDPNARPGFDAATRIRKFWAEQIDAIVSSTIEDYLLKYYSGDPDAKYEEVMTDVGIQPTAQSIAGMREAANAIVDQMLGGAGKAAPLAELQTGILGYEKFNGHNLFLVPKSAPHLRDAIVDALAANGITNVGVGESFADDRLSCYSQYTGIPAFMFAWTRRAEPDYETALWGGYDGMHMSETNDGARWQDYPNLMVENIWGMFAPPYINDREKSINRRAAKSFERARALGLTQKTAPAALAAVGEYTVYTLSDQFLPDKALLKNVDIELDGSPAKQMAEKELNQAVEEKAQLLFRCGSWGAMETISLDGMMEAVQNACQGTVSFKPKRLSSTHTVMTPHTRGANPEPPAGWEEKLAAELLRTCPGYMLELRGTVLVMERLLELVNNNRT